MQEVLRYLSRQWVQDLHRLRRRRGLHARLSERVYGIPPEQVVGSTGRVIYELRDTGPVLGEDAGLPSSSTTRRANRPAFTSSSGGGRSSRSATATGTSRCWNTPRSTIRGPAWGARASHRRCPRVSVRRKPHQQRHSGGRAQRGSTAGWTVVSMAEDWKEIFATPRGAQGPQRTFRVPPRSSRPFGSRRPSADTIHSPRPGRREALSGGQYVETAADIVDKLAVPPTSKASHCATRLRFQLRDASGVKQVRPGVGVGRHGRSSAGRQPVPGRHRWWRADRLQPDQGVAGHGRRRRGRRCRRRQTAARAKGPRGKFAWMDSFFEFLSDSFRRSWVRCWAHRCSSRSWL